MTKARSAWIALTYIVSSILIGPVIALGGLLVLSGNGDPCDRRYQGNLAGRANEYVVMDVIHWSGSGFMLVIGFAVLSALWLRGRSLHPIVLVLLTLGVLFMMLVYLALCFVALADNQLPQDCWGI